MDIVETASASKFVELVADLYDLAFSAPPHRWTASEKSRHREGLAGLLSVGTLAVAQDSSGLIGAAYGYPLTPGRSWWRDVRGDLLTPELVEEWAGRTFALSGLAVHPGRRRAGIGRALVYRLLSDRPEHRVAYSVMPGTVGVHSLIGQPHVKPVGRRVFPKGANIDSLDFYVLGLPVAKPSVAKRSSSSSTSCTPFHGTSMARDSRREPTSCPLFSRGAIFLPPVSSPGQDVPELPGLVAN
ncbi:GNAT family N-acetyltransferase [Nocardia sp. NPDC051750]|uniref:GNAT family N-acetyltransferase n=1 Tax=Nocardia sp. NPDC051750 TaxID=3364325 RepID=UPI00379A9202